MFDTRRIFFTLVVLLAVISISGLVQAVAPSDEAIAKWKADGTYQQKLTNWKQFKTAGGCAPSLHSSFDKKGIAAKTALGVQAVDTASVLVVLVDFRDHTWNGGSYGQNISSTPADFDSILFSNRDIGPIVNPTGSMTDFYLENSYGQFYVVGHVTPWLRMPSLYTWYEGLDDGIGVVGRARDLAADAVFAADSIGLDFRQFDRNNDGKIDGLVIIHAGRGAESGVFGIWSHKWTVRLPLTFDGVTVNEYTMNPEEDQVGISPIGVVVHEFGHFLGLPDLYDIDDTLNISEGLGRWALMASGNYNGESRSPAHLNAWCKDQVGFLSLINVSTNLDSVALPAVEFSPIAYRLSNARSAPEHWVVENRQRMGFDNSLPASGILIYHVDPNAPANNIDANRYFVGLEQADGKYNLELTPNNDGDGGDPFPGSSLNREFHDLSLPGDIVNRTASMARIGVWDITDSDSIMYADLDVSWSRPYIENDSIVFDDAFPYGNGDGNLDPGETIRVFFNARNLMREGYTARASLATSSPYVTLISNNVVFASVFNAATVNNDAAPITFTLADSINVALDSFFLTISVDSLPGVPGQASNYSRTFGHEVAVGTPRILIVDDDRGADYDQILSGVFRNRRTPTNVWHKNVQGIPSATDLKKYPIVFWHTGTAATSAISAADIASMRNYMDNGYSLFLSTTSGISDMHTIDSAFLHNYFGAVYTGETSAQNVRGVLGTEIGNATKYRTPLTVPFNQPRQTMAPQPGAQSFLSYTINNPLPSSGISYNGTYKSVLLSFPFEAIQDQNALGWKPKDTLLNKVLAFFGDVGTAINEGEEIAVLPESFELNQNFPNPFNPSTTISYAIRSRGSIGGMPRRTLLVIYNALGQRVRTLVDKVQSPGSYSVEWDGRAESGSSIASGVYFYRLSLGDEAQTKKMVFLK